MEFHQFHHYPVEHNFRRDYINRTADMMNTILKADRINNRVDEYQTVYAPEVPNYTKRWGSPQPNLWIDNLNKIKSFANNRKVNIIKHLSLNMCIRKICKNCLKLKQVKIMRGFLMA